MWPVPLRIEGPSGASTGSTWSPRWRHLPLHVFLVNIGLLFYLCYVQRESARTQRCIGVRAESD